MLDELCMGSQVYDDMGCGSMQLALIGDGCPLNSMASSKPHHIGDQGTASATASTEAGMLKPSVLPLLDIDHSPAYMEAETTARMPKPSVPPQPDGDHNPASPTAANIEERPIPITLECVDNLSNNRTVQGHTEEGTIIVIEALWECGHNPASMEAEMRNSCVQPQHDGGYNPASTAAMTASATETAQHEKVPLKASKLFQEGCPSQV